MGCGFGSEWLLPCFIIGVTPEFTQRENSKRKNKMSEKNEKQTSELSMEELDNVAGGGSDATAQPPTVTVDPAGPRRQHSPITIVREA
jgi:hypothetical protein